MSYSRWSKYSRWYTFWSASGADCTYKFPSEKLKRSQVFEICDMPSYYITYGELMDRSRSTILHKIEKQYPGVTWEELTQLQDQLARFITDVDEHFQPWNFYRYEWLYPIKMKLIVKYRKLKNKLCQK